jgi:hypothetical protein
LQVLQFNFFKASQSAGFEVERGQQPGRIVLFDQLGIGNDGV